MLTHLLWGTSRCSFELFSPCSDPFHQPWSTSFRAPFPSVLKSSTPPAQPTTSSSSSSRRPRPRLSTPKSSRPVPTKTSMLLWTSAANQVLEEMPSRCHLLYQFCSPKELLQGMNRVHFELYVWLVKNLATSDKNSTLDGSTYPQWKIGCNCLFDVFLPYVNGTGHI